ncbi:hypothetical protein GDO81_011400 [Engystomops pustulosus]|uniref:Uncharacterized protein n=1 Tax=Engystomops pustulosus TaxID=76066 RepID=A0AAV7BEC6_ENGPU|nr:hypothetical protein GDO81_011400 [Engystomops pustulosus]
MWVPKEPTNVGSKTKPMEVSFQKRQLSIVSSKQTFQFGLKKPLPMWVSKENYQCEFRKNPSIVGSKQTYQCRFQQC